MSSRPAEQALVLLWQSYYDEFVVPPLRESASSAEYSARLEAAWAHVYLAQEAIWACRDRLEPEMMAGAAADQADEAINDKIATTLAARAGEDAGREFDFCRTTMERAFQVLGRFEGLGGPADVTREVEIQGNLFGSIALFLHACASLWALCEGVSVRSPEIIETILMFLRSGALDAYVSAREALDLRQPSELPEAAPAVEADRAFNRALAEEYLDDAQTFLERSET